MSKTRRTFLQSAALGTGASALVAQPPAQAPPSGGQGRGQGGQGAPAGGGGRGQEEQQLTLADLKGQVPKGKLGKMSVSRVVIGGNPIGGWAHSRDLNYVPTLMKSYFTDAKTSETLFLCEKCGINTVLADPRLIPKIQYHWKQGGKIQFISQGGNSPQSSIAAGAIAMYLQQMEGMARQGRFDDINNRLEAIRKAGVPAGLCVHSLEGFTLCVEKGIKPDFWMKTFHQSNYPSFQQAGDSKWCVDADQTIEFMQAQTIPWIAFKTMAAGAIQPKAGFDYAFQNGADFIAAGMFDWQVISNANTAIEVLAGVKDRKRPWCS